MAKKSRSLSVKIRMFVILFIILAALLILLGIYAGISTYYSTRFLPGSSVNGMDVSGMTVEDVKQSLLDEQDEYCLLLLERNDATEVLTGDEIGMTANFDDSLDILLEAQAHWSWPSAVWGGQTDEMTVETMFSYDDALLGEAIAGLSCMDASSAVMPENAYISDYNAEIGGVEIVDEVEGTLVDEDILIPAITEAVSTMQTELDLEAAGCYVEPEITSDDPDLLAEAERLNSYLGLEITYEFGDDTVALNGEQLVDWLSFDDDGNVSVDEDEVTAFVRNLSYTYGTIFTNREFTTSYGDTITVEGGDYGWWMDESSEVSELTQQILNGESGVREPVWYQTAQSFDDPNTDYGDTYIEVNLTAQHLFFYKDGEMYLESDFVSGNDEGDTPTGTYGILYCERYATLEGEDYSSPVSYWMPFYNGVGLHDAPWRTEFGGTIYRSNGSHGCINLPVSIAKSLYENVSAGTAVIVYELAGTESSATSSQSYEDIASAIVDALDEISSETEITDENYKRMAKRITWVKAAYSKLSSAAQALVANYDLFAPALESLEAYEEANGLTEEDRTGN